MGDSKPRIQTYQPVIRQILEKNPWKSCPKIAKNGVKMGLIYIKVYMSIFIRRNFSHPLKVFLSETLYAELCKNLVICFKGTLASCCQILKKLPMLFTSFKFKATIFTIATKTVTHWKPLETTQNDLKASETIHNYNHPEPSPEKH